MARLSLDLANEKRAEQTTIMMRVQFAMSAGIVLYAGTCLTRYADRLSDALLERLKCV